MTNATDHEDDRPDGDEVAEQDQPDPFAIGLAGAAGGGLTEPVTGDDDDRRES